ncbi:helix-turn-helix transcriptional regulator [Paenibacillus sp. Marseille-Q4541]|uniref:helix-turn-helix domain-containing protein n=1 Tax=Paenibacillus sp. Marseille-Q4541 TaxID=2831522 RepID=UPI001BA5FBC0|nr:helix-turn-helix transcriptional regulator [Paenibacillus sp. Marseille-Q4541]
MTANEFGDYFRSLRRSKGYKTQKSLAHASGISQATISRIEDGIQIPLGKTMAIFAELFDVNLSKLLPNFERSVDSSSNEDFGDYLRSLRNTKGFTPTEIAHSAGLSQPFISQLESGQRNPAPETLRKLSNVLNVSYIGLMIKAGHLTEAEVLECRREAGIID